MSQDILKHGLICLNNFLTIILGSERAQIQIENFFSLKMKVNINDSTIVYRFEINIFFTKNSIIINYLLESNNYQCCAD